MTAVNNNRMRRREQGFTLIEVLIAFVVLTLGILGIIALLLMSKTSLHQSIQRTRAVDLADAMVERIRINPAGLAGYIGSNPLGGGSITSEPSPDCETGTCTPAELAAHDLWAWEQALDGTSIVVDGENAGGLIEPHACITFEALNGLNRSGMLNVRIQWRGLEETKDAVLAVGGTACDGAAAGADKYRRQVVVNTVVVDEAEF